MFKTEREWGRRERGYAWILYDGMHPAFTCLAGVGSTNVCIECIGQFTNFVCSSRTRKRVRLAHTKSVNSPLQSTQHYLCEPTPTRQAKAEYIP